MNYRHKLWQIRCCRKNRLVTKDAIVDLQKTYRGAFAESSVTPRPPYDGVQSATKDSWK
jgi:hypothetical protein